MTDKEYLVELSEALINGDRINQRGIGPCLILTDELAKKIAQRILEIAEKS